MNGRPEDIQLLGALLGSDPFVHLWGRRLHWVRDLGGAVSAWETEGRFATLGRAVYVGIDPHRDPVGRDIGSGFRDLPRARLAVELLARCPDPAAVIEDVANAFGSARRDPADDAAAARRPAG